MTTTESAISPARPEAGASERLRVAGLRLGWFGLFGVLPVVLMIGLLREQGLGWDFRAFYLGARAYLDGLSPYPGHSLLALANKQGFVYPAPMAALFAPLALLPYTVALVLWLVGSVAAIAASLRLLGVRDWRCLGALFLTHPVQDSVRLGTVMPVLTLLVALLWRYRERVLTAAALSSVIALSKIFLFPLLVWLAFTRRLKAAVLGSLAALALCLLAWLPIGLSTLVSYPSLLHALASFEETFSYSTTSFVVALGLSAGTAVAIAWTLGVALLAATAVAGRSRDALAFELALAASFVLSPIVWGHYYVLLAVPLAIRRPRLSPVWLAAVWLKADTLAMRYTPFWIGVALIVMVVQLDLARPLLRHRWLASLRPRARLVVAVAAMAALLMASSASSEVGDTRLVTLRAVRGGSASATGMLRVDRPEHLLCWRLWTQAVPARRAIVAIESRSAAARSLVFVSRVRRDGQSYGCVPLPARDAALARGLTGRPGEYRLLVFVPRAVLLEGTPRHQ